MLSLGPAAALALAEPIALGAAIAIGLVSLVTAGIALRARTHPFPGRLYAVAAPLTKDSAESFFVGVHSLRRPTIERLLRGQPLLVPELAARGGEVHLQLWVADQDRDVVMTLLRATYPGVVLSPIAAPQAKTRLRRVVRLTLGADQFLPIRTAFDVEPLAQITAALAEAAPGGALSLQLLVAPSADRWRVAARRRAEALRRTPSATAHARDAGRRATVHERQRAKAIEAKAEHVGFDCAVQLVVAAASSAQIRQIERSVVAALQAYAAFNRFISRATVSGAGADRLATRRSLPAFGTTILSAPELAALWHVPAEPLPHLHLQRSMRLPPPIGALGGERSLGVSTWADEDRPVGLSVPDSRHHLHLLGPTGTGKTTALLNLALGDIAAGRGVGVLDPKGDLVAGLLARIPSSRLKDVVLIAPEPGGESVGINPLELCPSDDPDLVADNTLTIFRRIYERSWGMRTDDILKSALLTLLRQPDPTLAHIPLLLTDPAFRARTVMAARDPLALDSFWDWFNKLSDSQRAEAIGPVLNKLRDFLLRPKLRRVLCQPRSSVDLRTVVDSGQILLADLSVGQWGETTSALLGSFLVAKLWQAILARSARPEAERRDFFLFIDEFQHFLGISGPFGDALAEARSLRLSLTFANQHLGQLPRELRESIASNARSRAVFQCGPDDAAALEREFAPLRAAGLMALPRFEMAVRLSVDGRTSEPFTVRTVPSAVRPDPAVAAAASAASRAHYTRPGAAVDDELRELLAPSIPAAPEGTRVGRKPSQ